jgi:putative transposase
MRENLTYGLMRGQWKPVQGLASEAPGNRKSRATDRRLLPTRRHCSTLQITNVLDAMPKKHQAEARTLLCAMPYAETQAACEALRAEFTARYRKLAPKAVERLADDWERLVTFYQFPREHWPHLRTSNVVESPFATVRLRTTAAKRFKRVENATALIWKMLQVVESTFRRLKGAELLPDVYAGKQYKDGVNPTSGPRQRLAA